MSTVVVGKAGTFQGRMPSACGVLVFVALGDVSDLHHRRW